MVKLVDTSVLGTDAIKRVGSSPILGIPRLRNQGASSSKLYKCPNKNFQEQNPIVISVQ